MKINLYQATGGEKLPSGWVAAVDGQWVPGVHPSPHVAAAAAVKDAFPEYTVTPGDGQEEDVDGEPVDGVATVGPLVTGSGPCHGANCRHVSHVDHRRELGRTAHDVYARAAGYPPNVCFDRLSPEEKEIWIAAAAAVADVVRP